MPKSDVEILIEAVWEGQREVKDAIRDLGKLDRAADDAGRGVSKMDLAIGDFIGGALTQVADLAIQGAQALYEYGTASIQLAADAAETASLFEVSLGPALDGYTEKVNEISDATGRSANKFNEAAAPILAMSRSMGFAQEEAGNLTATFGNLALDLNSFFNSDTAFDDIQSALSGSAETMAKYGINVKEGVLQQKALELGLVDTLGPLDQQTRALVILEEIQRQAADAVGDAARTAGGAVNQQRALEDAYYDLQIQIGEQLLPLQEDLVASQLALVEAYGEDTVSAVGKAVDVYQDLTTVLGAAAEGTDSFFDKLETITGINIGRGLADTGRLLLSLATFGASSSFGGAVDSLDELAAQATKFEDAQDTINSYYIGMGQLADATLDAAAAADELANAEARSEREARRDEVVALADAYEDLYKTQATRKTGSGGGDQLQAVYDAEMERLFNIETTNANLERQAAARRDREREVRDAIIDQQEELGALFEIGNEVGDETAAQLLFEQLQNINAPLGDIIEAAGAAGINPIDIEAATDAALLADEAERLALAVATGQINFEASETALETYAQKLKDNTDNAGALVDELSGVRDIQRDLEGDRQGTVTITVEGLEELREAALLQAGISGGFGAVVSAFGGDEVEAANSARRQYGAPAVPGGQSSSSTTQSTSRGER